MGVEKREQGRNLRGGMGEGVTPPKIRIIWIGRAIKDFK
jgi:hypothetical protein